jgi:uncharacterized protein (DUF488 family)
MAGSEPALIYTVGHSTRSLEEFIDLLHAHGVREVVDVRTIPGSARNPQFNSEALASALAAAGIAYQHFKGLGGLRRPRKDSGNTAWRNASFRGYADYMQTEEFEENLERLLREARAARVAIMCAEALPWRCHRSLIADALTARGILVEHLMSGPKTAPHELTPWAKVEAQRVSYPATEPGKG